MSKKRNKSRNPQKWLKTQPQEMIDNTGIYQLPENKSEFLSFSEKLYSPVDLMNIYSKKRCMWTFALVVFRINEQGDKCITVEHVSPPHKCLSQDIADSVDLEHKTMVRKCNEKEFVCAGFLAVPRDEIISSVKLMDIFDKLGVWDDYITNNGYKLKGEL